jgi:hypothetical protein
MAARVHAQWLDNEDQIQQYIDPAQWTAFTGSTRTNALEYVPGQIAARHRSDIKPGSQRTSLRDGDVPGSERQEAGRESRKSAQSKQNPMQVCSSALGASFVDRNPTGISISSAPSVPSAFPSLQKGNPHRQ